MKVVILAGGFGTRLSEYTESIPKPMVPIGGLPIIMQMIIEAIPGHDKEIYGLSIESILTVTLLGVLLLITKEISGYIIPRAFGNLRKVSEVASDALTSSGKALGVAGGCWASLYLIEDMDWLVSLMTLIMVVALVVTAFRFVGIIHAFVLLTDDD